MIHFLGILFCMIPLNVISDTAEVKRQDILFALRSNVLLPLLNVGAEFPVGRRSSIETDWYYPWLPVSDDNLCCTEALMLSAGYRFWFSSIANPEDRPRRTGFSGHSLGINAIGAIYDFQRDGDGSQGNALGVGLDYTYACRIAKGRMRLEFSLGLGIAYIEDRPYHVYASHGALLRDKGLSVLKGYVPVPTKCGISLAVPIVCDRRQRRREG